MLQRLVAQGWSALVTTRRGTRWMDRTGPWRQSHRCQRRILARPDLQRPIAMTGVTGAGTDLVAWGQAEVPMADNRAEHLVMPLLWASHDGRTWASVVDPEMDSVTAVTGGPHGFVATGQAGSAPAVWLSADGEVWERVAEGAFTSPVRLELDSSFGDRCGVCRCRHRRPVRVLPVPRPTDDDLDLRRWTVMVSHPEHRPFR